MFHLSELNRRARASLRPDELAWRELWELERAADAAVAALRSERPRLASSPLERIHARLERHAASVRDGLTFFLGSDHLREERILGGEPRRRAR
jgi:hypothetical protein